MRIGRPARAEQASWPLASGLEGDGEPRRHPPDAISAPPPTPPATASGPPSSPRPGGVVTFAELEERSSRLAQALFAHGLRPGDHVAVLLPNDDRTHEVAFALQRSGLYYTMVNTHLAAEEAAYIVVDCGARTLDHVRRARTPGGGAGRADAGGRAAAHDGRHRWRRATRRYDEFVGRVPGRAAGRGGRGLADALLLGHDRASQGDPPPAERPALRLGRHPVGDARRDHGVRRRATCT